MEPYIHDIVDWTPKGLLVLATVWLAKRLIRRTQDDIMGGIDKLEKSVAHINDKLEGFNNKINDIAYRLNDMVKIENSIERYGLDLDRLRGEIHTLRERILILEQT